MQRTFQVGHSTREQLVVQLLGILLRHRVHPRLYPLFLLVVQLLGLVQLLEVDKCGLNQSTSMIMTRGAAKWTEGLR